MDILRWIDEQVAAVRSPLFAVSLTAVPRADTPLLLFLHWHGFHRSTPLALAGVPPAMRSMPGSALQINDSWQRVEELDCSALDAAWQLGAWDLERSIRRGCNALAAAPIEAEECRRAFGDYETTVADNDEHLLDDGAPDRRELMALAARTGYIRWLFRPVAGGLWAETAQDVTLDDDGRRRPPCPVTPADPRVSQRVLRRPQGSRTTYCLGRADTEVALA